MRPDSQGKQQSSEQKSGEEKSGDQQSGSKEQNSAAQQTAANREASEQQQSAQGQAQGQTQEKSKAGQGKSSDSSTDKSKSDSHSGIGSQDGDKETKDAEQLKAMGKLAEIIGKRSASATGDVMVENPSGKQRLQTDYSQRVGQHADLGGEINRDEIPADVSTVHSRVHEPSAKASEAQEAARLARRYYMCTFRNVRTRWRASAAASAL